MHGKKQNNNGCETKLNIYCRFSFNNELYLKRHTKRHFETEVKCSLCDKVAPTKLALQAHMRYMHVERSHKCSICGKCFARPLGLKVLISILNYISSIIIIFFLRNIWLRTLDKIFTIAFIVREHLNPMQICIRIGKKHIPWNGMRIVKSESTGHKLKKCFLIKMTV